MISLEPSDLQGKILYKLNFSHQLTGKEEHNKGSLQVNSPLSSSSF